MLDFQLEGQEVGLTELTAFLRRSYTPVHLPIILLGPYSDELIDSVTPAINDYIFTPPKAKDLLTRVACQLKLHDTMKLDAEASLLRRVLPSEIIARMQSGRDGEFIADAHENLTFLFADLVSFTEMCSVTPVRGGGGRCNGDARAAVMRYHLRQLSLAGSAPLHVTLLRPFVISSDDGGCVVPQHSVHGL